MSLDFYLSRKLRSEESACGDDVKNAQRHIKFSLNIFIKVVNVEVIFNSNSKT